jgi:ABC-type cobalamin transport system ATPase subunit
MGQNRPATQSKLVVALATSFLIDTSRQGQWLDLLRDHGFGVLLAEQNAVFALRHAERGYILEKGRISHEGGAAELQASQELLTGLGVGAKVADRR